MPNAKWFPLLLLLCTGCQKTTSLKLQSSQSQELMFLDGQEMLVSNLQKSAVGIVPVSNKLKNGERISFFVATLNKSTESIIFDTTSVAANYAEKKCLKILSYDELVAEERKKRNIELFCGTISGISNLVNASYAGHQRTTTDFSCHSGKNFTTGTMTSQTYNPGLQNLALDRAAENNNARMNSIILSSKANLAQLTSILKKTTVLPGCCYGGMIQYDAPKIYKNEQRHYSINVTIEDEIHQFIVVQAMSKPN